MAYEKKDEYKSKGKSYLDAFHDANLQNWEIHTQVSFQEPGLTTTLPAGFVKDEGEMYGNRNGKQYGWTGCKHECPATSRPNKRCWGKSSNGGTGVYDTYAMNTFQTCHTDPATESCKDTMQDWGYTDTDPVEPPEGCTRNKWELKINNGWYKIEAHSIRKDHGNEGCAFEGRRPWGYPYPLNGYDNEKTPGRTYVEVKDGKLTFEDMGYSLFTSSQGYTCWALSVLKVYKLKAGSVPYPKAWVPSTTGPWMQVELDKSEPIGAVTFQQLPEYQGHYRESNMFDTTCAGGWLFHGDSCVDAPQDNRARGMEGSILAYTSGYHDQSNRGAIVRVSDQPCSGTNCPGEVCGKVIKTVIDNQHVSGTRQIDNEHRLYLKPMVLRHVIDCKGKKGKYVSIQLDGNDRILTHGMKMQVSHNSPLDDPAKYKDKMVCYGVAAVDQSPATPEIRISADPEDPVFYSTCLMREKELSFLAPEAGELKLPPEPYVFEDKCLECENFKDNTNFTSLVPHWWRFADKCHHCDNTNNEFGMKLPSISVNGGAWVNDPAAASDGSSAGTIVGVIIAILVLLVMAAMVRYAWTNKMYCFAEKSSKSNQSNKSTFDHVKARKVSTTNPATELGAVKPTLTHTDSESHTMGAQRNSASTKRTWAKIMDPDSGHPYYFNETTGESVWVAPAGWVE